MKKCFKFLAVATIVAAGLVGCSNETPVAPVDNGTGNGSGNNGGTKTETFATIQFIDQTVTKASGIEGDAASTDNTSLTGTGAIALRLFVFDNNILEIDTTFSETQLTGNGNMATFKIMSGTKDIFAVQSPLTTGGIWATAKYQPGSTLTIPALTAAISIATAPGNIEGLTNLYTTKVSLLTNRSDSTKFNLTAGISDAESKTAGNTNNIKIRLYRPVAKVYVSASNSGPGAANAKIITLDSMGVIGNTAATLTYRMMNILTQINPFQIWNPSLQTPYYNAVFPAYEPYVARGEMVPGTASTFFPKADTLGIGSGTGSTGIGIAVPAVASPAAGAAYYITENMATEMRIATFAVIKAQFTPTKNHFFTALGYNNTNNTFVNGALSATDMAAGTTFYALKTLPTGIAWQGIAVGNIVQDEALVKKITYHLLNPGVAEKTPGHADYTAITVAQMADYFDQYPSGTCYYRLNIGNYTYNAQGQFSGEFGVKRNTFYKMNIDAFNKLGENSVYKLIGNPGDKLKGDTYLSISVEIAPWATANSSVVI